ncbi:MULTISPECIES: O-antigen ligase [unclassified Novosphingobium]|uniref:O-antigen ligase family protein n=1 Tax=unclassified Novosphingobium TaxID=2644732 RepID=UPI00086BD9FB|nr:MULTISPECIES: O-antigen ligase family protein [unclassified Novosphingobium]ODU68633.1 MAG: hypothetical protein ABT11_15845 [Novosphingobium sp. SCN 66-18]QCI93103.1 O-antigen ligase family protein [Novosphingobium sp. EMRT-2]RQW45483.1 O-antigen ligase family protein [Novosphingobium sp. LASN5T]
MNTEARDDGWRLEKPANRQLLAACLGGVLLLVLLGPLMVYSDQPMLGEGNAGRQLAYFALTAAVLFGLRPAEWRRLIAVPIPLVVALGWCWLSLSWSIDPSVALRRMILTTLVIWIIFVSVRQIGSALTVNILRIALCVTLFANFVTVALFPDFGIHQANAIGDKELVGSWRGIMMHKNFAGEVSALLIPLLIFDAPRKWLWPRVAGIVAAAVFLYFSHSKTSLGLIGVAVLAGFAFERLPARRRVYVIPLLMVVFAAAALLNDLYSNPLEALLRDPEAVTGRSSVWRALLAYLNDHLWLGSGYGSFWNVGPISPIFKYAKGWITELANGHNGFLDLAVQIGVPGALLVVASVIVVPLVQVFSDHRLKAQRVAIVIAFIMFAFMHNTTESSLFDRDVIMQVMLMFALALIPALKAEADRADRRRVSSPWATASMRHALS